MNQNDKIIINEYRNNLIMLKVNTTKVNMSIKSIDDIKIYEEECKLNLNKLETLSKDHKLYEKDYDDLVIVDHDLCRNDRKFSDASHG